MDRFITSMLALGILCAILLYLNTGSWSILAVLAYLATGTVYRWIHQRKASATQPGMAALETEFQEVLPAPPSVRRR